MSESEQMGRCRREMTKVLGRTGTRPSECDELIADAIDRLAADVAAVLEAVCDRAADPHAAWREVIIDRDLWIKHCSDAIRERDDATRRLVEATRKLDEARAEVERLKAIVHSDAGHMAKILIENERLRAAPAAPQPAAPPAGWLTEEEKRCLPEVLDDLRRWGNVAGAEVIDALLARAGSPPVVEGGAA